MGLSKCEISSRAHLQTWICQGIIYCWTKHHAFMSDRNYSNHLNAVFFCLSHFICTVNSIRANVFQSPITLPSNVNWDVALTFNASKIWYMKLSPSDQTSNTPPTFCGHSNWTHQPVAGARRLTITLKAVTSVTEKTKLMFCWDVWFKHTHTNVILCWHNYQPIALNSSSNSIFV